jgi:tyrosyl-tRNA synthetase
VLTGNRPVAELDDAGLEAMRREIPAAKAAPSADIADLLAETGLASSKTEARRLLQDNAIAINGVKTQKAALEGPDFQNGRLLIRKGKAFKDSALIELV